MSKGRRTGFKFARDEKRKFPDFLRPGRGSDAPDFCRLRTLSAPAQLIQTELLDIRVFGLRRHRKKRLGKYSGGMLRRAGIAQALLGDPKILIIDEPTTGLDPEERLYFLNLISRISADKNIILSTHIIHDVENVCENVCILEKGEVMYAGATQGMVDSVTDRTWLYTGKAGEEKLIKKLATVTNITYTTAGMQARYVADEPVVEGSEKIVGTLEDAYIAAVGGVSR